MTDNVMVAFLSLVGTVIGSFAGILIANKLSNYRIEQLEKKLDKYADKQDEMSKEQAVTKRDLETAFIRIDELKDLVRK
jgi:gas vesicle protein